MRNEVVKMVMLDSYNAWGDDNKSYILFKVDHDAHTVEFEHVGGTTPTWDSFVSVCTMDNDIRKELRWALYEYKRTHPISIKYYKGRSGCRSIKLLYHPVNNGHEWARGVVKRVATEIYITCNNKLNTIPDLFAGDLLDLLNYMHGPEFLHNSIHFQKTRKYRMFKHCKYNHCKSIKYVGERVNTLCGTYEGYELPTYIGTPNNTDTESENDNEVVEF